MKRYVITTMLLLGSLITNAQQHDCVSANKLIKEDDGIRNVKNENAIVCYTSDAFNLVSKSAGQIVFSNASFDSYINEDGYKVEAISNMETKTEVKGWYQVTITHGPTREVRIRLGSTGVTYIVEAKNENFIQYEKPVHKYEETKDLSSNIRVTYDLDSFVNAKIRWLEDEINTVDCQVAAKLFVGHDGKIDWHGSTVKGDCVSKENYAFIGRVKQALNESWFVPARDKNGDTKGQYYETTLQIKGPGRGASAGTANGAGKKEGNAEIEAAKKEAVNEAKKAAKDGAKKLLKGFGRP